MTDNPSSDVAATRAEPQSLRARNLAASLSVKDLEKSVAWYRDVVGFTVDQKHERDGVVRAVAMKAGEVRIMLGQDDGAKGWDRAKGAGLSLHLTTIQSIDEIAKRIKELGWTLDTDPTDMPWGARVIRFKDPDGFMLVISSAPAA